MNTIISRLLVLGDHGFFVQVRTDARWLPASRIRVVLKDAESGNTREIQAAATLDQALLLLCLAHVPGYAA